GSAIASPPRFPHVDPGVELVQEAVQAQFGPRNERELGISDFVPQGLPLMISAEARPPCRARRSPRIRKSPPGEDCAGNKAPSRAALVVRPRMRLFLGATFPARSRLRSRDFGNGIWRNTSCPCPCAHVC